MDLHPYDTTCHDITRHNTTIIVIVDGVRGIGDSKGEK